MIKIITVFTVVFFVISALALTVSIKSAKDADLTKNCRSTALMAFVIGLILLYLMFVFS